MTRSFSEFFSFSFVDDVNKENDPLDEFSILFFLIRRITGTE